MTKQRHTPEVKTGFVRKTVTIPTELAPFIEKETAKPEHSGNLSSYLRSLIIRDQSVKKQAA